MIANLDKKDLNGNSIYFDKFILIILKHPPGDT